MTREGFILLSIVRVKGGGMHSNDLVQIKMHLGGREIACP